MGPGWLVESAEPYGVDLLGPTRLDYYRQARQGAGFDAQHFQIDWAQQHATCRAGKTRIRWTPAVDHRGHAPRERYGCALSSATRGGRSPSGPSRNIKPYKPPGSAKRGMCFRRSMRAAPGLKVPSHAACEARAYDGLASWA
jgi:hypothetical protein